MGDHLMPLASDDHLDEVLFRTTLVRDCQLMTAFRTTAGQYFSSILATHPTTEPVFVGSLLLGWLIGTFHLTRGYVLL